MSADIEMRWVEAWSDLCELVGDQKRTTQCRLPDGRTVNVEECKGWLQDAVYDGFLVRVERGWVNGKPGVVATTRPIGDP